jgi:hypothetical protein
MTVQDVRKRAKEIKKLSLVDPEAAHAQEDELWKDVLSAIASKQDHGRTYPDGLARAALVTTKLEFPRWSA